MNSKIAFANSIRVFHFFRFNSSICIVDQNDSIMALSYASPMDPNEGMRPAERIFVRESPGSELDSVVGVDNAPWSWFALLYRHVKGVDDQL